MRIVTFDNYSALALVEFSVEEIRCMVAESEKLGMNFEELLKVVIKAGMERKSSVVESGNTDEP